MEGIPNVSEKLKFIIKNKIFSVKVNKKKSEYSEFILGILLISTRLLIVGPLAQILGMGGRVGLPSTAFCPFYTIKKCLK